MQFQQLRYFVEVARVGSISTAAKNLYISQPSLSQQMINLEKELGIPLLIRHSKSVSLSDAGEQFLIHARRIIGETEQLSELMKKHSLLQTGTLHIGMLWIANYLNLIDILCDYKKIYTGLQYKLTVDGSISLLDKLSMRKLHAAFVISSEQALEQHKDIFFRKIQEEHYVAVVSSQSPLAEHDTISVQSLQDVPLILPDQNSALYKHLQQYFDQYFIKPNCICHTSRTDLVISLVSQGFGVGFSSYSIAQRFKSENFKILALEEGLKRTIFYTTLVELLDYPSIRTFTRYVTHYHSNRPSKTGE